MAVLLGAAFNAPAQKVTAASAIPPPPANLHQSANPEHLDTDQTAPLNAVLIPGKNPAPSQMMEPAYRDIDRAAPTPPAPPSSPAEQENSDWRHTAALLSTLAILVTIAVRRHKAETPWA